MSFNYESNKIYSYQKVIFGSDLEIYYKSLIIKPIDAGRYQGLRSSAGPDPERV